jgi:XTP/dITP diphosphohydrolase
VKLYCATTNPGKLREFRMAAGDGVDILALPELSNIPAPDETGETFEANAILKALHYGTHIRGYLFAEDSGLAVDALGGEPGIYSARYAGPGASDAQNNELVLEKLREIQAREAKFVCVIALVHDGTLVRTFRGEVQGQILREPRGGNGFGYDPLFYYPDFGCSFGEVSSDRKYSVSHRGQAVRAMISFLK